MDLFFNCQNSRLERISPYSIVCIKKSILSFEESCKGQVYPWSSEVRLSAEDETVSYRPSLELEEDMLSIEKEDRLWNRQWKLFTFRNPRVRSLTKKGTGTFGLSIRKRWSNNLFIVSASIRFIPLLVPPGNSDSIASRAAKKARTVRACRQMGSFLSRNDVLHDTNPNPGLLANCCQQLRDKGKVIAL